MARPHAFRVSTFLVTGAALAFALPAAADNRSPAPIVYKGAGQGSAQGGIPQADFSAVQDQWRGPVTNTGSASLPAQRERIAFSYPGSSSAPADIAPLRQMASVESEPLAALPDTSTDRMWPAQMDQQTRTPIAPRTLTLGGAEQKMPAASTAASAPVPLQPKAAGAMHEERGLASWYGETFHGNPTANGEIFDMNGMTAAHRTLPLPSLVQVVNEDNGKEIVVRVNDRGPFEEGRVIDLSKRAAETLGVGGQGTMPVTVRYLGPAPALPDVQMASAEGSLDEMFEVAETVPAAPPRPDLYGDMLLGGVEPTLGIPDPGKDVATPARLVPETELAGASNVPAAPRRVVAQNLAPVEPAPAPVQAYQPAPRPQAQQAAYTPDYTSSASSFTPRIYVQVGAFADISNAQGMDVQVGTSFNTNVESVRLNGADYFRVMVGPFATRDAAERAKVQLRTRGVSDGFVVVR